MTNTNTTPTDEPRCVICGVPLGPFEPDPLDLTRCFSHGPSNLGAAAPKPVLVEEPRESCDECGAVIGANPDCGACCDLFCCPPQRTAGGMGSIDAGGAL